MGSAARAYDYTYSSAQPRRHQVQPDFQVLPGKGKDRQAALGVSPFVMSCFRIALVVTLTLTAVALCRVWLTASTTSMLMASEGLVTQIESTRSQGADLEVQQSILANPTRIQTLASENLAMGPASDVSYLSMADSALATDASGSLSLSGSLAALDASAAPDALLADASDTPVAE
ncbi:MAG: hypothetical protein HGA54_06465 [Actinobacteria bacterium]|nr:hypothetical protein [Actinomycetota bacterium]